MLNLMFLRLAWWLAVKPLLEGDVHIAHELLEPGLEAEPAVHIPNCPVLVLLDMTHEQLGERLFDEFCRCLGKKQIAGGDALANLILGAICDLKLPRQIHSSHITRN
ncbi:hypothetical protein ACE6H2_002139 [Prunus campanulata]